MPLFEVGVAVTLLLNPLRTLGLFLAVGLLLSIAAVVVAAWVRGASGDCGCMGVLTSDRLSFGTVLRLLAFVLVAGVAVAGRLGWLAFGNLGLQDSSMTAILSILGFATLVLMIVAAVITFRQFARRWGGLWTS